MANKAKTSVNESTTPVKVKQLQLQTAGAEPADVTASKFTTRPEVGAAATTNYFNPLTASVSINALVDEVSRQSKAVNDGNLDRAEAILISQAHSLDAIFNEFCRRAAINMGEYLPATETYMRMALKAQSQCRATLQTLGEIKTPRSIAFIRQANVANGPQHVNNGPAPTAREAARNSSNELLEVRDGEWLDTGTARAASAVDSAMATMEPIDGPAERGR